MGFRGGCDGLLGGRDVTHCGVDVIGGWIWVCDGLLRGRGVARCGVEIVGGALGGGCEVLGGRSFTHCCVCHVEKCVGSRWGGCGDVKRVLCCREEQQ